MVQATLSAGKQARAIKDLDSMYRSEVLTLSKSNQIGAQVHLLVTTLRVCLNKYYQENPIKETVFYCYYL